MQDLTKSFCQAKYELPGTLCSNIWGTIEAKKKKSALIKLCAFLLLGLASFVALISMVSILLSDFARSGFYQYFSLAWSDGALLSYSKEFGFTLLESLPVQSLIFSLSLVFVLFLSLKYAARNMRGRAHRMAF